MRGTLLMQTKAHSRLASNTHFRARTRRGSPAEKDSWIWHYNEFVYYGLCSEILLLVKISEIHDRTVKWERCHWNIRECSLIVGEIFLWFDRKHCCWFTWGKWENPRIGEALFRCWGNLLTWGSKRPQEDRARHQFASSWARESSSFPLLFTFLARLMRETAISEYVSFDNYMRSLSRVTNRVRAQWANARFNPALISPSCEE